MRLEKASSGCSRNSKTIMQLYSTKTSTELKFTFVVHYCMIHKYIQGGPKSGVTDSWPYFCQILTDLEQFIGRFLGKFAVKWILKISPHLAYVATLPFETLMSAKQAINDKLQGSVATYLTYGEVLITKLKNVYCWVCEWNFFLNRWIFVKVTSKKVIVSFTLCAWPTHC